MQVTKHPRGARRDEIVGAGGPTGSLSAFSRLTRFFFRKRTAFLPLAALFLVLMADSTWKGFGIGMIFVVLGQATRMWSAGHLVKCDDLTTSGPFAWVRNPLYVGSFLMACGYCAISGGWIVWAVVIPMFAITHGSAVIWEEKFLLQTYGDAFAGYCKSVPRWIPLPPRGRRSEKRFSWAQMVINAELKSLVGTFVVVLIFAARLYFGK